MGMSAPGEIKTLTAIAPPDVAVVTNVAPVHLEFLKTLEAVAAAKREILEGMKPGGVAVLNGDDSRVRAMSSAATGGAIFFGFSDGCDVRALSGAERATLLAGFAWAVAEPAELQLLVIDDVWFDRATLDGLLEALCPVVGGYGERQAIVCAVEYEGDPPAGWTRVDV